MKILVANRGEIAVRVLRTCREMGLPSVAIYSDPDRGAPHVTFADEAWALGGDQPGETYLRIDKIVEVARRSGATAVHPGYGFLAENAGFAAACADAGLLFIGPDPKVIDLMGRKIAARHAAAGAGVPVVPGTAQAVDEASGPAGVERIAASLGYPLLVKAVAGGGGKGMRLVERAADLAGALQAARSEAATAFGEPAVYLERALRSPRHVEIQLLADAHGAVVPFVERECSIQRRHQKVVEESPSPVVGPELRAALADAATRVARAVGYTNAGTIEFLVDAEGGFYFLEMNTRLQVEHPVTELVTGVDLVAWQIRVAAGERLDLDAARTLTPAGHAIECRIYAEDPDAGFLPSPGRIAGLRLPEGPGVRVDSGVAEGFSVPLYYDPMLAKLVVWGEDRARAIARMARALEECELRGVRTTVPFFRWLAGNPDFRAARFNTTWLDRVLAERRGVPFAGVDPETEAIALTAAALHAFLRSGPAVPPAAGSAEGWKRAGRREALRADWPS